MYGTRYGASIIGLIHDNGRRLVGVRVRNIDYKGRVNATELWFHANVTSDFSGDLVVERNAKVVLANLTASPSISTRRIRVNGGTLYTYMSNQISREATVSLHSGGAFHLGIKAGSVEHFKELDVYGSGVIDFQTHTWGHGKQRGERSLFLNDLSLSSGSELFVKNWENGPHHIFVKKSTTTYWKLYDYLSRIKFEGFGGWAGLRTAYKEGEMYWEIYGQIPEPSAYGAAFGAVGLVLALWSKKRRTS